jgi:hypothetical protein
MSTTSGLRRCKATAMKVGETATRTRRVEARDIELFTEISGDRAPHPAGHRRRLTEPHESEAVNHA